MTARERLSNRTTVHDLKGQQFGRLKVLARATNDKHNKARWLCACDCGRQAIVGGRNLLTGLARSCGCLRKETVSRLWSTHRMTRTPTYNSYQAAKGRCTNPNNSRFAYYGGRGIRFLYTSFEQFLCDLGERPIGGTLERCDNNGDYEPGNCRWATQTEQANNKRNNRMLMAFGRTWTLCRWAREIGIYPETLRDRLKRGWSVEKALTAPRRGSASGVIGCALDAIAAWTGAE
jgi:hypothetical protein